MIRWLPLILIVSACTNTSDDFAQVRGALFPAQARFAPQFVALLEQNPPLLQVALPEQEVASNVILESRRGDLETWLTPEGASLIFQDGFLVGTRGFGQGLMAAEVSDPLSAVLQGRTGLTERFHTYLTGDDVTRIRAYRCLIENRGAREVTIGGGSVQTRLMAEDCRSVDQSFLNLYWIRNSDNRIVQSRQWPGEEIGVLTTRVVPQ